MYKKKFRRLQYINTLRAPLITHIYIKLVEKRIFIVNSCSSAVKLFHAEEFTITFVYNVYNLNDMTFFLNVWASLYGAFRWLQNEISVHLFSLSFNASTIKSLSNAVQCYLNYTIVCVFNSETSVDFFLRYYVY